jgi:serine/threonine protein kinase
MAEPLNMAGSAGKCPQCGALLPKGLPPELCPKCLLKAGLPDPAAGPGGTVVLPPPPSSSRALPQPGEVLGHYTIHRLLGAGGMGAVYEAEDQETGRRVALKVLGHGLDTPEARERFFREGRLAASINHTNSVYIFGTEEIAGTPVISMELVNGGTLQDRVRNSGPLPVGEAVDAVLQILAGLEAAQKVGILHRDVKPSNCFLASDGTVKIGDFGLSISTAVRTEPALTASGSFLGTPAFCSPEQLRGEELSIKSDMYAVGATLFFLLTGRTPFEAKNVVALLATVLEQRAPSPATLRTGIPSGLAKAVLRCLEKQPAERFKTYDELRRALAPYSSAAVTPATVGLRLVAGVLDTMVFGLIALAIFFNPRDPVNFLSGRHPFSPMTYTWMGGSLLTVVLYYTLLEGLWGASLGKAISRLRVVGPDKNPPGLGRAFCRALLSGVLPALPSWVSFRFNPARYIQTGALVHILVGAASYVILAALFATVRRRNGFAAVHDLLTGTRVISRPADETRPQLAIQFQAPLVENPNAPQVGPYRILDSLGASGDATWLLGYDLRLLRKVWLRLVPPGTPPMPQALRCLGRVARLRWLTGKRSSDTNWDAFEASTGAPLLEVARQPRPWSQVRFWLYDLAQELSIAEKEHTLPTLSLNRVWLTSDGRLKILDFPAPGIVSEDSAAAMELPPNTFLTEVANLALKGAPRHGIQRDRPMPLYARSFLQSLPRFPGTEAAALALKPLLNKVAAISRLRRATIVASIAAIPILMCCSMMLGLTVLERTQRSNPRLIELSQVLNFRNASSMSSMFGQKENNPTDRQFAVYIANHFRDVITNQDSWQSSPALIWINGERRHFAEQSLKLSPAPTPEESEKADALIKKRVHLQDFGKFQTKSTLLGMTAIGLVIYVSLPALLAGLLFRGGLAQRIAGVAFVRRDGALASRLRVFWRALLAWCPLVVALFIAPFHPRWLGPIDPSAFAVSLVLFMALLSLLLPERGLQDRLAGTWPVPR